MRTSPSRLDEPTRAERAAPGDPLPRRHLAAFDLENTLIASNVVDSYAWLASPAPARRPSGWPSWPTWCARRRRCSRSTAATAATSCAPSTAATRARRPTSCATTPGSCSTTCSWPSRSRPASPGCASTGPSATGPCSSPAPSTSWSSRCARCSTTSSAPASARRDGRLTGRLDELPPTGEARALVLADYAEAEGLDLDESMAYADSASDLPMLEAVGFPVAVNPEAKLAAIARRRGWHVEHWDKADGRRRARSCPSGPVDRRARTGAAAPAGGARRAARRRPTRSAGPMKALVFERNLPRFAASRVASVLGSGRGAGVGPLAAPRRRRARAARATTGSTSGPSSPASAAPTWPPSTAGARATSRTSSASRSCPATRWSACSRTAGPTTPADARPGTRAVIEPVLGCAPRHIEPAVPALCRRATPGCASNVAFGRPRTRAPDRLLRRHRRRLVGRRTGRPRAPSSIAVPDAFTDEDAVMVEPTACAVHAALSAGVEADDVVAVIGAGTLGLATVAALDHLCGPAHRCTVMVGAKHPHQRQLAESLGADAVVAPDQLARAVRRRSGSLGRWPAALTGGADVVFDCVGSSSSLAAVAGHGPAPAAGSCSSACPAGSRVDLAPLWHRELTLVGAYAYGTETAAGLVGAATAPSTSPSSWWPRPASDAWCRATYPLERYEEAIAHAGAAGRRGAVKVVFDLRNRKGSDPMSPRPGFVLEVDRSTPPTLFWHGEGSASSGCPSGSRVIYAPEPLDPLEDPDGRHPRTPSATRSATATRCRRCSGRA